MFSLKNKTVFLTGSTGGIGKEIAFQMSSLGAKMVITGTNEEKLKDLSYKLPNENDYIVSNLDNSQNIENLSNQLSERGYSIDILINNAGITRDNLSVIGVFINPGAIQLTVIPLLATSDAIDFEKAKSPAFEAE